MIPANSINQQLQSAPGKDIPGRLMPKHGGYGSHAIAVVKSYESYLDVESYHPKVQPDSEKLIRSESLNELSDGQPEVSNK